MDAPPYQVIYYMPDNSDLAEPKWIKDSTLSPKGIYLDFWEATVAAFCKAQEVAKGRHYIACPTEGERFWYDVVLSGEVGLPIARFEAIDSRKAGEAGPFFYDEERVRHPVEHPIDRKEVLRRTQSIPTEQTDKDGKKYYNPI